MKASTEKFATKTDIPYEQSDYKLLSFCVRSSQPILSGLTYLQLDIKYTKLDIHFFAMYKFIIVIITFLTCITAQCTL